MKTHQQALDIAGDYDNLSDKIQAYLKERGLVAVPEKMTSQMNKEMNLTGTFTDSAMQVRYSAMLAAAPNPFEGEE